MSMNLELARQHVVFVKAAMDLVEEAIRLEPDQLGIDEYYWEQVDVVEEFAKAAELGTRGLRSVLHGDLVGAGRDVAEWRRAEDETTARVYGVNSPSSSETPVEIIESIARVARLNTDGLPALLAGDFLAAREAVDRLISGHSSDNEDAIEAHSA